MENEKSVYEIRLEEKDKIINFQQNIINKLINTIIILIVTMTLGACIIVGLYMYAPVSTVTTEITGDNNNSVSDTTLENDSELNIN